MGLKGREIQHNTLGRGVIVDEKEGHIIVKFTDFGLPKQFKYPDVDGKYYTLIVSLQNEKDGESESIKLDTSVGEKNGSINRNERASDMLSDYIIRNKIEYIADVKLIDLVNKKFGYEIISKLTDSFRNEIIKRINRQLTCKALKKDKGIVISYFSNKDQKKIEAFKKDNSNKKTFDKEKQYIIELIKGCVNLYEKKFYTQYEIKKYLVEVCSVKSVFSVTENLLIQVCKELYEEDGRMYYVESDYNVSMLYKANSKSEWMKFAVGKIIIPKININGQEYDIKQFTLYVYDSLNNMKCILYSSHQQESVIIKTLNIEGEEIMLNAFYCKECNKYYTTLEKVENDFPLAHYPIVRIEFQSKGYRKEESELTLYGYNAKEGVLTEFERHGILRMILDYKFLTKAQIIKILNNNIGYNGKQSRMASAVRKWKEDILFVENYGIYEQRIVNAPKINVVYHGKKI